MALGTECSKLGHRMTICVRILHANTLLDGGGADEFCVRLALAVRQAGAQVWLAGPATSRYVPIANEGGVPFVAVNKRNKVRLILDLARTIRREQIQIVHAHHGRDYWPTVLAARISGLSPKVVLSRHLASSPGTWISRQLLLSQCDALIAVSRFVERILREGVGEHGAIDPSRRRRLPMRGNLSKIHCAYGGIDMHTFQPRSESPLRAEWNLAPDHFVFGVVGAYNTPRGKGQREFLMAAARVVAKVPNARFLIIGYGTLAQTLREDIERLGLVGKAWLTPFCADMPSGMNAIDCLVHPAVGTEALGLVLCEASACGRPIIASDLDGIPEALVDPACGTLIPPGSVDALEQAMLHWARQTPWTFARRMEVHQTVASQFSLEAAARRYLEIYRSLP